MFTNKTMKISITIPGRGSTFYLAQQLEKKNLLSQLITSYPKFIAKDFGVKKEHVKSILSFEILRRVLSKLPINFYGRDFLEQLLNSWFDYSAAKSLKKCDLLWTWTSFSLASIEKVHQLGGLSIVEAGNAPMVRQREILKEEYEKFGISKNLYKLPTENIIQKVNAEYLAADYISVPSLYAKREFINFGIPEEKIFHMPYGVDLSSFRQIPKTDQVFRVIFVGGMTIRKGVHYLLEAFFELNLPNSELLLVGSYNPEIDQFFHKYKGKFSWIGHIPQAKLYQYYSQSSVFCLPSLDDGFAAVIPQAMACGLPVVCSTHTGAPDLIQDGVEGFLVPPKDVTALKDRLLFLFNNPEKAIKMGEMAKQKIKQGFTWENYGDRITDKFREILARK